MFKKLLKFILISLIAVTAGCGPQSTIETVDSYMVAFIEYGIGRIRIRYAGEDPTAQWVEGGAIEGGSLPLTQYRGTGLGTHQSGTMAVLGTWTGSKIDLRLGIGPFFSMDPEDTLTNAVHSSPDITHIDGGEYMIAYQILDPPWDLTNGRLAVIPWDSSPGRVISEEAGQMSPLGVGQYPYDDHLIGRPAIAYLNGKQLLLVIWNRTGTTVENPLGTPQDTIQYALGTYPYDDDQNTIVNWTRYGKLNLLEEGEYVVGSPSLTIDGENYYLGILYLRAGELNSWNVAVYESPDGLNWTQITSQRCPPASYYADIAVQSNGDMLIGCFAYGRQNFYLKRDGEWIELDAEKVLGGDPLAIGDNTHDFAIGTFKLQIDD